MGRDCHGALSCCAVAEPSRPPSTSGIPVHAPSEATRRAPASRVARVAGRRTGNIAASCGFLPSPDNRHIENGRMTKFVIDPGVAIRLVSDGLEVPAEHRLLAPTLFRSQVLAALHEAAHRGDLPAAGARTR